MQLIHCFIENFGKLHRYELSFSPDITVVLEENGYGKTTLAAFIRAMFFGMPRSFKSLEKNDRKRYLPWQGGAYGGSLDFEHQGKTYRIERSFGVVPRQDTFKLYTLDPYAVSNDFSEKIGEELFGVSVDSFEKTTYMPQTHWTGEFATAELKASLADLIENAGDAGTYETALQALRAERSKYIPYRGKDGEVARLSAKIATLEMQSEQANHAQSALLAQQSRQKEAERLLQGKQEELQSILNRLPGNQASEMQKHMETQYAALEQQHKILDSKIQQYESAYPSGLPNQQELEVLRNSVIQLEQAELLSLSEQENRALSQLEAIFSEDKPEKEVIDALTEIELQLHEKEQERINVEQKRNAIPSCGKFATIALFLLGILLGGVGFYATYINPTPYKTIFFFAAILFTILGIISGIRNLRNRMQYHRLQKHLNQTASDCILLQEQIAEIISEYVDVDCDHIDQAYKQFKKSYHLFTQLQEKQQELQQRKTLLQETASHQFDTVTAKYFRQKLPLNRQTLMELTKSHTEWSQMLARKEMLETQLASFKPFDNPLKKDDSTTDDSQLKEQEQALRYEIEQLQKEILQCQKTSVSFEVQTSRLPQLQDELAICIEQREKSLHKVKMLDKAIEHLENAHNQISGSYIQPVQDRLSVYLWELMQIPNDSIFMDKHLSLTIERDGLQRELGHFSFGELDMISLCMRVAIIDVLYADHTPLLILDDPFVNLDENHLKTALSLLKRLGASHQILYFTCHSSRII